MSKVAVITGCSSGIGLATAKTFLEAGYKVFGIDINTFDTEHLSALPKSVEFFFHQANLTDKDAPKTAIEACKDKFGTVDVLANVAGIMDGMGSADAVTEESWAKVMNINLTVPVLLMKEVLEIMKENGKGGAIVNVSSKSGTSGAAAGVAYTARVATNIASSLTDFDAGGFEANKPFLELHINIADPSSLKVKVDDIANAIFFLASDKASAISGVVLPVDSAWSAT